MEFGFYYSLLKSRHGNRGRLEKAARDAYRLATETYAYPARTLFYRRRKNRATMMSPEGLGDP